LLGLRQSFLRLIIACNENRCRISSVRYGVPEARGECVSPGGQTGTRNISASMGYRRHIRQLADVRHYPLRLSEKLMGHHCQWIAGTCYSRTGPICSQSLNSKTVEVLVNPRGLCVDVLNDDTGGLLSSRARGHTYALRLTHEAEANNNPRTEALTVSLFFGLSNVGKSY
jgi:hypothetical protein